MEAVVIGLPLLLAAWACILLKWRTGVYALIAYTPFTGFVVAAMYPSPLGTLVRDFMVVIPLYISFFLFGQNARLGRVPPMLYAVYGLLVLVVLFAAVNPAVPNLMVAGIGVKVWLFYIPMIIVGAAFVRSEADLRNVLRALVATGWIAWTVGIVMYLGAALYDFEATVKFFYGEWAREATQQFTAFYSYGAPLYRLPGSFQFNSQYGVFCFFMLFPIFMLLEIERSRGWRAFTWASMVVGLIAGFTSGARGNFVLMPLIFIMVQFFKFRAGGAVQAIVGMGAALFAALSIAGIDTGKIYGEAAGLTAAYGKDIAVMGIVEALDRGGLFGLGVGANTGAARHGQDAATAALIHDKGLLIENYYGKAIVELGAIGFLVVFACMAATLVYCLQLQFRLTQRPLKGVASCCTAMVAFTMLVSFKGWALDTDPMNYYFFLTLGMVFALPYIERQWIAARYSAVNPASAPQPAAAAEMPASARGLPAVPRFASRPVIGRPGPYRAAPPAYAGPPRPADENFNLGPRLRRPEKED
ncbi:MAG: hypothetical protein KIT36_19305 [Alphaproteobacteria bacterium]|nr:hypothetical protein [Alphaproteobacteria bacterium]